MSKNIEHVQHLKSRVVINGSPKLPNPSALTEGEIAVNFAEGYETISIKNSSGNISTFVSVWDRGTGANSAVLKGGNNTASGANSVAEGYKTSATSNYSHAEGYSTTASADYSHAEGYSTTASGYYSHAEGNCTTASGYNSHVEGGGTTASGPQSHAEGGGTKAYGTNSHAEGGGTTASGESSHAEGTGTIASGSYSHAEGGSTTANGMYSHAEGYYTTASGGYSHAEGSNTTASGSNSHAEGTGTIASGSYSHAEGGSTTANGMYSHAEGYYTTASGGYSHAEGSNTTASGSNSHAEGYYTTASGSNSHAEGYYTTASGMYSHAEGNGTIASGECTHVEGSNTTASGYSSHAEGGGTHAIGNYSHAEGYYTIANNKSEHASGQYNVSSSASTTFGNSGNTLFSVGNGTADNARHNAFEIRQNGDIYIVNKDGDDVKLQDEIGNITVDQVLDDTTSASTNPVSSKAVYKAVTDNELVWTNAFVALSGTVSAHTENTEIHVTAADKEKLHTHTNKTYLDSITGNVGTMAYQNANSYSSATEVQTALTGKANTATTLAGYGITDAYTKSETSGATELTTAFSAKANTTDLANFFDDAKYEDSGTTKVINFYHGNTIKATIDASDFIVDGMVDDVKIENGYLVIDFNTESRKQDISIPLTDIFDPSNYYNKTAIDSLVGSGFTSSSITEVIIENEEIVSAALTDLDERKLDASAYTPTDLSNYYTKSETSGATEISNALEAKVNSATFTGHTADTTIHFTTGAVQTQIDNSISGKVNTSDIVTAITSSNSGSTNPIATNVVAENELVVSTALNDLNTAITPLAAHTADTSIHVTQALLDRIAYLEDKVIYNGHAYVDLGLPSGTKWATMNVGASSETDYGNYYQYGKGAAQYAATSGQSDYSGTEDPLDSSVDTAAQVWGGSWHMPTRAQMEELTANTTYQWVTNYKGSGINGGTFTATNGAVLFIPAAGLWKYGSQYDVGLSGSYWGSSPDGSNGACGLYVSNGDERVFNNRRKHGFSVRPVVG